MKKKSDPDRGGGIGNSSEWIDIWSPLINMRIRPAHVCPGHDVHFNFPLTSGLIDKRFLKYLLSTLVLVSRPEMRESPPCKVACCPSPTHVLSQYLAVQPPLRSKQFSEHSNQTSTSQGKQTQTGKAVDCIDTAPKQEGRSFSLSLICLVR